MKIGSNAGHTLPGTTGCGAVGLINESVCTREIAKYFNEILRANNHSVIDCTIDKSTNYLKEAVAIANRQNLDYSISHHLNCSDDISANGVEVWIYDFNDKATVAAANRICDELSKLGLRNRGVKENKKFAWVKNTKSKAMIIEYLFCSNAKDVGLYNPQRLAEASCKGLIGQVKVNHGSVGPSENNDSRYSYKNGEYNRQARVVNVGSKGLNIRQARNTSSQVIGKLVQGSVIKVDYCIDNWFSVWENGKLGFVYGEYVQLI